MVEGACLENRCTFARTGGSNPFLTAERNAADRMCDRLFLDAGGSQACLGAVGSRKQPVGPRVQPAAFHALQGPAASGQGCRRSRNPGFFFRSLRTGQICLAQKNHSLPQNVADPTLAIPGLPRFRPQKPDSAPDLFHPLSFHPSIAPLSFRPSASERRNLYLRHKLLHGNPASVHR